MPHVFCMCSTGVHPQVLEVSQEGIHQLHRTHGRASLCSNIIRLKPHRQQHTVSMSARRSASPLPHPPWACPRLALQGDSDGTEERLRASLSMQRMVVHRFIVYLGRLAQHQGWGTHHGKLLSALQSCSAEPAPCRPPFASWAGGATPAQWRSKCQRGVACSGACSAGDRSRVFITFLTMPGLWRASP